MTKIGDWIIINDPVITLDTDTDTNFIIVNIKHLDEHNEEGERNGRNEHNQMKNKYALRVKNNIILMDFKTFVNDIAKSYKYSFNSIKRQFMIDIPRSVITVNGITNGTAKSYFNMIKDSPWITRDLSYIVVALCTQAVLATPFEILHNTYIKQAKNNKQQLYLADTKNTKMNKSEDKMNICLTLSNKKQKMYITKKLRIFNIDKDTNMDKTLYNISLNLAINLMESKRYVKFWWKIENVM
jgi:hypothetical protein